MRIVENVPDRIFPGPPGKCTAHNPYPRQESLDEREIRLHVGRSYSTLKVTLFAESARQPEGCGVRSGAMNAISQMIRRFLRSEDGPTATEYAVMIAVICIAVIGALSSFGIHMDTVYSNLAATIPVGSGS